VAAHALQDGWLTATWRRVSLAAALILVLAGLMAPAQAAPGSPPPEGPGWEPGQTEHGGTVGGTTGGSNGSGGSGGGDPSGVSVPIPGPWTQRIHVPYCPANLVSATGRGAREYTMIDDMCTPASSTCGDEPGVFRYWIFSRRMNAQNQAIEDGFDRSGPVCRGPDETDESQPPTITIGEIREMAEALAPTPSFVIEPGTGTYVNIPTNFAAQAEAVTVTVNVLGFSIPVDFTPSDVSWSFGDGTSGSGEGVRGASVGQAGAVEHSYARSGAYDVTVTVAYDMQINLPTGPVTFPTPISRSAPARALDVGEIQSVVTEVD